jgi:hypothetical protein
MRDRGIGVLLMVLVLSACTGRGMTTLQQNRDPLALKAPPRELAFNDRCRREYVDEFVGHTDLSECERERLGAGVEELDLERAVVDRTLLPDQLVHPLFVEQTRAVLVNIGPSRRGG